MLLNALYYYLVSLFLYTTLVIKIVVFHTVQRQAIVNFYRVVSNTGLN